MIQWLCSCYSYNHELALANISPPLKKKKKQQTVIYIIQYVIYIIQCVDGF